MIFMLDFRNGLIGVSCFILLSTKFHGDDIFEDWPFSFRRNRIRYRGVCLLAARLSQH